MEENSKKDEEISAFAFTTGRAIEAFINNYNKGLLEEHKLLQAKILDFHHKLKNRSFKFDGELDVYENIVKFFEITFNIETNRNGKIEEETSRGPVPPAN